MSGIKVPRKPAMDIIRCFAFFFVVSVHFFLHNGFYKEPVVGVRMYIMTLMRSFFMICVPLFIVLTGYLTGSKTIGRAYYKKIFYTVGIYALVSCCCVAYKVFFMDTPFLLGKFIKGFFNYTNAPYSWYVEMYIGLFLLCPLLNVLYTNLKSKKEKQILLATLLLLTALPRVINIFIPDWQWALHPTSSDEYVKILPTYWTDLYPICYYFIGCYLREYKVNLSCKKLAILSVAVFFINGTFNFYRSYNTTFIRGAWQDYGSLLIVLQTVLFFAFFDNLSYTKFPNRASKVLQKISGLCYGGYLLSWIFDTAFYEILNESVSDMRLRLNYYPVIVPCVFLCSLILSYLVNQIYSLPTTVKQLVKSGVEKIPMHTDK